MPSPFPGMDPYLEGEMWQEFHSTLANAMRGQLMPLLRPKYVALLHKRYVLDSSLNVIQPLRTLYPDVHVVQAQESGAAATMAATDIIAPTLELPNPESVPQLCIEIRDVAERRLVTLIEILSPANKRGDGARDYHAKRQEILATSTHLLEIDLLRGGRRIPLRGTLPRAPYYVYLSRMERRPHTAIWPIALRQPLPTVPIPLLAPDPDVPLSLQEAVTACFALVGYETLLDYHAPPPPPALSADDTAWMSHVLHQAGFR